jgi:hypothetical protein
MHRICWTGLFAGLGLLIARSAAAEPQQEVRVDAGLFSAVGELGLVYQADLFPYFAVEGGAGVGFTGVQLSAMAKGGLPVGRIGKLTSGVGLSLAVPTLGIKGAQTKYVDGEAMPSGDTIPWLNVDAIGLQQQYGRTVVSAAVGVTMPLRSWRYDVAEVGDTIEAGTPLPQGRIGIGQAF